MSIVVEYIVSFIVSCLRHFCHGSSLLKTALSSGVFFLSLAPVAGAQNTDTLKRTTLEEISISAQRTPSETRTATPTQVVDVEELEHIGALRLSDALKQMAGVTLKDYGGVGGIKTVSARGLGSQFSAVTIDGIPIDDAQNGQVDLGRYVLGTSAYVSLSQGQEQGTLLSARAYAAGNTLNMETAEPQFWPGEHVKIKVGSDVGSFGFLSPALLWEQRWSRRIKSSFFANYIKSNGDYPFTLYYTVSHQDSSSVERRRHSAVWMFTADGNLFCTLGKDNTLLTKVHYLRGEHELPGPVHYYSQAPANENTREEAFFVQTRWRLEREQWKTQILGKFQTTYDFYEDSSSSSITGYLFNEYRQREGFLNASAHYELPATGYRLTFDLAADGDLSRLESNLAQRNDVTRSKIITAAAANYHVGGLDLGGNLVYTSVQDRVVDLDTMPLYQRLTPYLSVMYTFGQGTTLRLFYKSTFRVPNFGELYFFQSLPRNLRPEHAHQLNLGVTHAAQLPFQDAQFTMTVDAYYNHVSDKIVARPGSNMYYWSMENLGIVDILGLDATADFQFSPFTLHLTYTYQHAVDHSQEGSKVYGHQIVYTPRHSGGGSLRWENAWVNLGVAAMVVGERYSGPQNTEANRLPAYCDLSLNADRKFDLRLGTLTLHAAVLNLLDMQYEIVRSYPMMGRNWRFGITYEF